MQRLKQKLHDFFYRKPPEDIWELCEQARQMEERATISLAASVIILGLNIALLLIRLW